MSEPIVPAWKRAGLKHSARPVTKSESGYDPLKEGLKRATDSDDKPIKQPKRPKLAKSDRPAPTFEPDQLAYLRQYTEDKSKWKFSKQKQNWILKHIFTDIFDDKYEEPLYNYVRGLQGSARNWVIDDSMDIVIRWNEFMRTDLKNSKVSEEANDDQAEAKEEKTETQLENLEQSDHIDETLTGSKTKNSKKRKNPETPAQKVPSQKMALRAQKMITILKGEIPELDLLDKTLS